MAWNELGCGKTHRIRYLTLFTWQNSWRKKDIFMNSQIRGKEWRPNDKFSAFFEIWWFLYESHRIEIVLVQFNQDSSVVSKWNCNQEMVEFQHSPWISSHFSYGTIEKVVWIAKMWLLISLELTSQKETDEISPINVFKNTILAVQNICSGLTYWK